MSNDNQTVQTQEPKPSVWMFAGGIIALVVVMGYGVYTGDMGVMG